MSDLFVRWRKAKYGDIEFPYTDLTIKGSLRHVVHEYLKRPGGEVEKLGRKAYTFEFRSRFTDLAEQWTDLYPSRVSALISQCESERTYPLWVPPMEREFKVKAVDWTRSISAMLRNGEDLSFSFVEDSTEQFTTLNLIGARSGAAIPDTVALAKEVSDLGDPSALDALDKLLLELDRFNTTLALADAEASYQSARVDGVIQRCSALAQVPVMNTPNAAPALTLLLGIWGPMVQQRQASALSKPIALYEVKRPAMSVVDISLDLYQVPTRSAEIMRLNSLDNPMRITRGTFVRYLPLA